jgi:hypothetical protein
MILNKFTLLAAREFVNDQDGRYAFSHALVTEDYLVATDGKILIQIPHPSNFLEDHNDSAVIKGFHNLKDTMFAVCDYFLPLIDKTATSESKDRILKFLRSVKFKNNNQSVNGDISIKFDNKKKEFTFKEVANPKNVLVVQGEERQWPSYEHFLLEKQDSVLYPHHIYNIGYINRGLELYASQFETKAYKPLQVVYTYTHHNNIKLLKEAILDGDKEKALEYLDALCTPGADKADDSNMIWYYRPDNSSEYIKIVSSPAIV